MDFVRFNENTRIIEKAIMIILFKNTFEKISLIEQKKKEEDLQRIRIRVYFFVNSFVASLWLKDIYFNFYCF